MKIKNLILHGVVLCMIQAMAHGQAENSIKYLSIGERMPDIKLSNLINFKTGSATINSFKGKKLLLDFWSTHCLTCIESFPKLEKLQKEHSDKFQIIAVTYEDEKTVRTFMKKREELTGATMNLPIVFADITLSRKFEYDGQPFYVWIDEAGIIRNLSYSEAVSSKNIKEFISTGKVTADSLVNTSFNLSSALEPLFFKGNGGDGEGVLFYSSLSRHINGMPTVQGIFNIDSILRARGFESNANRMIGVAFNHSIAGMFQVAYNDFENQYEVPFVRTILNVRDKRRLLDQLEGQTQNQNLYNYHLIVPNTYNFMEVQKLMQEELKRFFSLEADMETRTTKCWVLTTKDSLLFRSQGGYPKFDWNISSYKVTLLNSPMSELQRVLMYNFLDRPYSEHPFVDATGFKGNVDIVMENVDPANTATLIRELAKYGLELKLLDHQVNMLVISDKE